MKDDDLFQGSMDILSIIVGHLCHMDMVEDSLTANAVALQPIANGLLPTSRTGGEAMADFVDVSVWNRMAVAVALGLIEQ